MPGLSSKGAELRKMATQLTLASRLLLRGGAQIPVLGLGVYLAQANGETEQVCLWALKHGYRHIDTAEMYRYILASQHTIHF